MARVDDGKKSLLIPPAPDMGEAATRQLDEEAWSQVEPPRRAKSSGSFSGGALLGGRFRIIRWIATGGMGEVYEAEDLELGGRVAVKMIREDIADNSQAMDRFRREISLAHRVTHPGVCRIFDLYYHSGGGSEDSGSSAGSLMAPENGGALAFLTMELLVGETLDERMAKGEPMALEDALPLVRQMASALAAAHDAGVIHRDFKCSNVILVEGPRGERAVVTDFGLARQALQDTGAIKVTSPGEILGSPAYMSPEQATGEKITPATDVYTLGIVIFRMVTGHLPFGAKSPLVTLVKRLQEPPPSPRQFMESLEPRWEAAIKKCLDPDPAKRFASPRDLIAALDGKEPAGPPRGETHAGVFGQRPNPVWAFALLVILVCFGVFISWKIKPNPEIATAKHGGAHRASVAVLGFKNLSARSESEWISGALAELLTTELAVGESLRLVPGEKVSRVREDLSLTVGEGLSADTLTRVGKSLNSRYVVLGSYLATGRAGEDRLRLDVRIQDTKIGETLSSLSETASEKELLDLVARLGDQLRHALGVDLPTTDSTRATLPANPDAARFYTEGLETLRSFKALEARDLLVEAVAADPEYPLARVALAQAHGVLGYDDLAKEEIRRAFELSENLPRQERLSVEAKFRELMEDWQRAIEINRSLFEFFPDHPEYGLELLRVETAGARIDAAEATLGDLRRLPALAEDPRVEYQEAQLANIRGQYLRTAQAADRAVEKSRRLGARLLMGRALLRKAGALWKLSRPEEAKKAAKASRKIFEELGDLDGAALALNLTGILAEEEDDTEKALEAYSEALRVANEIGSRSTQDVATNNIASIHLSQGDLTKAKELYRESLNIARELGNKPGISVSLANLGSVAWELGEREEAKKLYEESAEIGRQLGNVDLLSRALIELAFLAFEDGDLATAEGLIRNGLEITDEAEFPGLEAGLMRDLGSITHLRGDLVKARQELEDALARAEKSGEGNTALQARIDLAFLAFDQGYFDDAVAAIQTILPDLEDVRWPGIRGALRGLWSQAELARGESHLARAIFEEAKALAQSEEEPEEWTTAYLQVVEAALLAAESATTKGPEVRGVRLGLGRALDLAEKATAQARGSRQWDLVFSAQLVAAKIELDLGQDIEGKIRLAGLQKEAGEMGFHLYVDQARILTD